MPFFKVDSYFDLVGEGLGVPDHPELRGPFVFVVSMSRRRDCRPGRRKDVELNVEDLRVLVIPGISGQRRKRKRHRSLSERGLRWLT